VTELSDYGKRYRCLRMEREHGVLVVRLHTDGAPFVFDEPTHHQLGEAFDAISDDQGNKVVVLTGTGDQFCAGADAASFAAARAAGQDAYWMRLRRDGDRMLRAFVDIEVPVIAVVNGPVAAHSELPLLADVVLAAGDAYFQDGTHFLGGLPPGDGMHIVWTALIGINRARYFLMTGQRITADEALRLGLVGEVWPRPRLLPAGVGEYRDLGVPVGTMRWLRTRFPANQVRPTHYTNTIDCHTVVDGWIELLLDDGAHRLMPGDSAIVKGVDHGWRIGPAGCSVSMILLGTPGPG
jgi:enoyl-CoA hydratase/carnithine racemase